jgi:hypothetical protein
MSTETRRKRQVRRWTEKPENLSSRFFKELDKANRLWNGWLHVPLEGERFGFGVPWHHMKRRALLHKGRKP